MNWPHDEAAALYRAMTSRTPADPRLNWLEWLASQDPDLVQAFIAELLLAVAAAEPGLARDCVAEVLLAQRALAAAGAGDVDI